MTMALAETQTHIGTASIISGPAKAKIDTIPRHGMILTLPRRGCRNYTIIWEQGLFLNTNKMPVLQNWSIVKAKLLPTSNNVVGVKKSRWDRGMKRRYSEHGGTIFWK